MTTWDDGTRSPAVGQVPSFVQIRSDLLYAGVDSDALHLYLILLDKSWKRGCCWPSDRTIGEWLGAPGRPKSPDTVNRVFKKLEAAGLVSRTQVPYTGENPSGRLITVYGKVQGCRKPAAGGAAKQARTPAANLRHEFIPEKKEDGPPIPASGAAPEQTPEERLAAARQHVQTMKRWPTMHAAAVAALAELEAELGVTAPGVATG